MTTFKLLSKLAAPAALALVFISLPAEAARAPRGYAGMPPAMGDQAPTVINISAGRSSSLIVVPAAKSRIIHFDRAFTRVHVGSGDVAEVVPLSSSSIYVLGKKRGSTNLTIMSGNSIVAVIDVVVSYDVDGLRQHLADLVPTESVQIQPAGDALILSGHVSSSDHLRTIVAVADRYAPGAVTNLITLGGSQQVVLEVKFAEVQRSALVNLGLNSLNGAAGNNGIAAPTATTAASGFNTVGGLLTDSKTYFLRGEINALEQSGMVRTLAEPNVVALSGETATFLAGGEFPIPVVQSSTGTLPTTTIEYKDFGVGLSFTPTVISADAINLVLKSEVSALDSTFAVQTNGISVPGLKVRRATTTVELRNGQSFAIAGLIQDDFNDTLKALPGVGSIPIIGALLRSTNYQRNQTELVVFITVHLVTPGPARNIAVPTDRVLPPTPAQILGLGHNEETAPQPPVPGPSSSLAPPTPLAAESAPAPVASIAPAPVVASPSPPVAESPAAPTVTAAAPAPNPVVAPAPTAAPASVPAAAPTVVAAAPSQSPVVESAPAPVAPPPTPVAENPAAVVAATPSPEPTVEKTPAPVAVATATPEPAPATMPQIAPVAMTPPAAAPAPEPIVAPPAPPAAETSASHTNVAMLPPTPADAAPVSSAVESAAPVPSGEVIMAAAPSGASDTPAHAAPVAPTPPAPVIKTARVKPIAHKVHLASAVPVKWVTVARKPAPRAADELPVTAPDNLFAASNQPDSNGNPAP